MRLRGKETSMFNNRAPKWSSWTLNKSLLNDLKTKFGENEFTCKDAYVIYSRRAIAWSKKTNAWGILSQLRCMTKEQYAGKPDDYVIEPDSFQAMNVRNTLSKAAYEGVLIRVRRGVYKF